MNKDNSISGHSNSLPEWSQILSSLFSACFLKDVLWDMTLNDPAWPQWPHTTTIPSLTGMLMTPVMIGTLFPSFRTNTCHRKRSNINSNATLVTVQHQDLHTHPLYHDHLFLSIQKPEFNKPIYMDIFIYYNYQY